MAVELLATSTPILVTDSGADRLYRWLSRSLMVASLVLALVIAMIELPEVQREEQEALPPQLARILLEERAIPEPPKPEPKPEPEKPKPEKPKPEPDKPKPKPEEKPQPPSRVPSREDARARASQAGVMAAQDDLAALRELADTDLGAAPLSDDLNAPLSDTPTVDRSLLTARAGQGSGGINSAAVSRTTGGAAIAGRSTSTVQGSSAERSRQSQAAKRSSSSGSSGRSDEEIRLVLERAKASLYTLYNRELRKNPLLKGKVIFELVIEPSGKIGNAKIVSSELASPELEKKLLARIKLLDFGARDVARTTTKWAVSFLPQ